MQRYNIFYKKRSILHKNSKIHFHIINNEHANIPQLSDLTKVCLVAFTSFADLQAQTLSS